MKYAFEKAKNAVESLFWDTCFVEGFREETTTWGERLHQKETASEGFPCRLTERAEESSPNGLLTETDKNVVLLYPADRKIPAGSVVRIRKENGEERRYQAAGKSRCFLTHNAVGLRHHETI